MSKKLSVLNVEDSKSDSLLIRRHLVQAGYELIFERVDTADAMRGALETQPWDIILADYSMPRFSALAALDLLKSTDVDIPFIVISGAIGEESAVGAMLAGAHDYLMKGNLARLVPAIEREISEARNRSAHRQAEANLKASEERYRVLFDANPHAMYAFDRITLEFLAVNAAFLYQYGYAREELLSSTIAILRPPEDPPFPLDWLSAESPGTYKDVVRHVRKDGTILDVELMHNPFVFEGKLAVIALSNDISATKLLEGQLRQAQKMEAVGQLAAGIAHDFNNLLTVINGYSDLAIHKLSPKDPLRDSVEQINKAGLRAASLTRQLLAFGRKQVLQPRVLDLNLLVSELEKMLRRVIGEHIDLRTLYDARLGTIHADPGQIEQVIMNLVVNARDAMPAGGRLTIETANVFLDEDYSRQHLSVSSGHYVMLAVGDTGVGMDVKTRERIFEPFFTTKGAAQGTGLGLSTVYGIVQQSGGHIWVYTEPGLGTTFKIYLKRTDRPAEDSRMGPAATSSLRGTETILLTEDDDMVRSMARTVLDMYGYQVIEAANPAIALSLCEEHPDPIDLLITDVVMPGMDGSELAKRAARIRPDMKVLFMSGYADFGIVHQGVLNEGTPFVQKPFAPAHLAAKVRELLG